MDFVKIKKGKIFFLFLTIFIILTILLICSRYYNGQDEEQFPKNSYVEINGKRCDFDEFNSFLAGNEYFHEFAFHVEDVKKVLYIGNGNQVGQEIFSTFPNARFIRLRKCIIEDARIGVGLQNLRQLDLSKCTIKDGVSFDSESLKVLTLDFAKVGDIDVNLPRLTSLVVNYNDITEDLIAEFAGCKKIDRISLIGSDLDSIEMLEGFNDISCLRLLKTKTSGYEKLNLFSELNEIYLDHEVDRSNIDFMYGNLKNGDIETRAYFVKKRYGLNE